ncbi:Bro8 [Heliothis virescens ascovirus 3e]|uniref:Bro8 n=1 Tax=Heliothis virescens ascovirus 3e TaxID=260797 RepID=A4KXE6_HVAVE|nr:Bro8 [Heliothis virescens ascovirus 3e]ABO37277.1 Bro8 [Heliothis virescens ascovirus 3e]
MSIVKVQFANQDLEVISIRDNDGQLWLLANPFARILEYSTTPRYSSASLRGAYVITTSTVEIHQSCRPLRTDSGVANA